MKILPHRTFFWVVIAIMVIFSIVVFPNLPEIMPIHWGIQGQADRFAPKAVAVVIMPVVAVLIWWVIEIIPRVDPKREENESLYPILHRVQEATLLFIAALHVVLLTYYDQPDAIIRLVFVGVGLLFAVIGNEMVRVRYQNRFIGIRNPWTFASEKVWRKVHKVSGRVMFWGGIITAVLALLIPTPAIAIPFLVFTFGGVIAAYAYSYWLYQQEA